MGAIVGIPLPWPFLSQRSAGFYVCGALIERVFFACEVDGCRDMEMDGLVVGWARIMGARKAGKGKACEDFL